MPRSAVPAEDKLSVFSASTHAYKIVDGHSILVDVFIPKRLLDLGPKTDEWKKKQPVMIRIHGGWLVGGQRNFAPWWPKWTLSLAYHYDAIVVSPDYRLLPESSAEDLLDDLDDFWAWLSKDLADVVRKASTVDRDVSESEGLEVDLDRIVITGESAGGYSAIQLALSQYKQSLSTASVASPRIRALIAIYPMLDFHSRHWTEAYPKQIFDHPQYPSSIIDRHLAAIIAASPRPIISNAPMDGTERGILAVAYLQHGRFPELLGGDRDPSAGKRRVHPEDRVVDGAKLPPTLFVHGTEDSGVPVEGTDKFIELLKKHGSFVDTEGGGDVNELDTLMYARVPGDHGFDGDLGPDDAQWIKDGLDYVEKWWLS